MSLSPTTADNRHVTAVLGPTNTGKTHLAIERMLDHETGMIGLPLRLLAREVYNRVVERVGAGAVALVTGEEKIKPANPRFYVATVEAMPLEVQVDFLAIDEIQLAADPDRGHVFTHRLLYARGSQETLLLGATTMTQAIRALLPGANIISRPRLSKLSYAGQKKLSRLPRRSAIVAFSAAEVYTIAELIQRQRGGAAVVLGALSPRTRNAQVALYQSGEVDFLVATDAIGMGLNLDVDHVAFAAVEKFDGHRQRPLYPAELAQIAGRAGRHLNDGTFGVTGAVAPFDQELVRRLEEHHFDPVKALQWRNAALDFSSLQSLQASLAAAPEAGRPYLVRARPAEDITALENLSHNAEIRARTTAPAAVRLLWELCQIPDYRNISQSDHSGLIATLFNFLHQGAQVVPEDWFGKQVAFADRTDGDIDTIANRIAHVRTWTFVANRPHWLRDPHYWQEKTRAVEDRLSDALHAALTRKFVDKRTSVLMRRLRDKDELHAEIGKDGAIYVEDHFVGRLDGFNFTPDSHGDDAQGKAARGAAARVLTQELAARAERLAAAPDEAIALSRSGVLSWEGSAIARLEPGSDVLAPEVYLLADEHLQPVDREKVKTRLTTWVGTRIGEVLAPLVKLSKAEDIEGLARGVAYRLVENLGSLNRLEVAEDIRQLDQPARAQLRRYGVRFGAYNIFMPPLLKPAAAQLVTLLWALRYGPEHDVIAADLPTPPRAGLTSAPRDKALADGFYRAAGFHPCGNRVVRMDILERLGDLIRPLVYWRASEKTPTRPQGSVAGGGFKVHPDMLSILGCGAEDMAGVLRALGYKLERRPAKLPPGRRPPTVFEREIAHLALAQLAPVIGQELVAAHAAKVEKARTAEGGDAPEVPMEEIWRVGRRGPGADATTARRGPRRRARDGGAHGNKSRSPQTQAGRGGGRRSGNRSAHKGRGKGHPRRTPVVASAAPPAKRKAEPAQDSPFAALAKLKEQLGKGSSNAKPANE